MAYIEFKNVSKYFYINDEKKLIIDDINIEIKKGELILIKGLSGSGKTTILNLLASFDKLDDGNIIVDKTNINNISNKNIYKYRKEYIGFASIDCDLIEDKTILENIILSANLANKAVDAENYIKKLGLENKLNYFPNELSESEKMKTVLLRAICKAPKILLCDEIFLKMDLNDKKQAIKLIHYINKKDKTTVIITSRDNCLANISNKVISLKDRKIQNTKVNKKIKSIGDIKW